MHHITQAIRAHELYKRDAAYVVKDGEAILSLTSLRAGLCQAEDGLTDWHQAIEVRKKFADSRRIQTLATITFQNFFRMYKKIAGMTETIFTVERFCYKP